MIELKNIVKRYQIQGREITALANINLKIEKSEIYGVIGRSGAGKSSLIRCVNLLERPSSGEVWVNGQELQKLSAEELRIARHQMGMVFQHYNLLNTRTVFENIALPLEFLNEKSTAVKERVMDLLNLVGLTEKAHVYPNQLSGGQKQRVAIARALATQPKILLCDEMTSALDPETTYSILKLIKSINQKLGVTVLLITHEMQVIKEIADRVAVLENAEIVEEARVIDLFARPKSPITKSLLNSAIKLELPPSIQAQLVEKQLPDTHPIFRIEFVGDVASKPIIDELTHRFKIRVNILQANLDYLRDELLGVMILSMNAGSEEIERAVVSLKSLGISVECLGYSKW